MDMDVGVKPLFLFAVTRAEPEALCLSRRRWPRARCIGLGRIELDLIGLGRLELIRLDLIGLLCFALRFFFFCFLLNNCGESHRGTNTRPQT